MSPEQVRGERVDARTDVYSLGVTLYELLTLSPAFAGATEAAIRNRIERGEVVPLAAARRGIPWDVATVCATAMAPEREQRYQTAADLAADLQAVLERRPIAARSPGPGLRLRRFVQRRPTLATALLLGALLVVGAPSALLIQEQRARGRIEQEAIRAANAERDAVRDAATARRVVQFLREVFQQGSPDEDRGRNLTARELLDRGLRRISAELSDEPAAHAELLDAMAGAYLGLRATALAIELYEQSLALQRQLGWSGVALHRTLCGLGAARHAHEDYVGAEELLRTVLRELPPLSDPDGLAAVAPSLQLAAVLKPQGRIAEALQRCDDVIAALQRPGAPERQLADALQKRGALRRESGAEEAGDGDQQQALAILRRCLPPDHPEFVDALCDLGLNAYGRRDPAQAEPLLVEAEALADRVFPAGHPKLAQVRDYLGLLRSAQGRIDEAQLLLDRSEASFRQSQPPPSLAFARHLTHRSKVALSGNDKPRAIAAAQEACAMFRSLLPDGSLNECVALDQVTLALGMAGRAAEALPYARRGFELRGRLEGAAHQQGLTAAALARVAEAAGERDLAAAAADAALAQLATLPDTVLADLRFSWLGIWLMNQKRHDDAARVLDRHLAALRATGTLRTGTGADALVKAGVLRHFLRRPAESLPLLQEGYALAREANEPQVRQEAADWLGFLLAKAGRAQEALPYAEEALALVRQTGPPAAIHSAAVTLAFVQRDLGDREAATALLWPVVDELVAKGQQGGQAPRVLGLLFELLPDGDQRDAARQRLRAAARVLLPADHALRQRLEAGG
jgi:serine/threonine-protein kinase